MGNPLEVKYQHGIPEQTTDETIVYSITTTNWVSSPTSPSVVVYDEGDESDVTTTVMPAGSHSAAADVITLKPLTALTEEHTYRVEVKFVVGSSTYECFMRVKCKH